MHRSFAVLVSIVCLTAAVLSGCSTSGQCDTVANLSAQTAKWICLTLSSFDTTVSPSITDMQRLGAIESFIQDQARASTRYADALSRVGETSQAQQVRERGDALAAMTQQIANIRSRRVPR